MIWVCSLSSTRGSWKALGCCQSTTHHGLGPLQVTVPVVLPDQAPMSVAILALQRSDKRLLSAALQLGPFIQEAAAQLVASGAAGDAPAAASSASSSPAKPLTNGTAARKQSPGVLSDPTAADAEGHSGYGYAHRMCNVGPSKNDPHTQHNPRHVLRCRTTSGSVDTSWLCQSSYPSDTLVWISAGKGAGAGAQTGEAKAEVHKSDGNAAFQAGAFEEAVKAYTQAIEADPACAVYWSNRALAYLKVGFIHTRA